MGSPPPDAGTPNPQATPSKEEKKQKEGFLRLWNFLPDAFGEIQLLQDEGAPQPTVILSAESQNLFATYRPFKPSRYVLKLIRTAEPKDVLKTFDIILRNEVYVSIFAHMVDEKPAYDLIDDTYDLEKTVSGRITFRQYIPNTNVSIKASGQPDLGVMNFGDERQLENFPLKAVMIHMQARTPDGKMQSWPVEIDFRRSRRASVWIVKDDFGRFRPRVSLDGPTVDTEVTK